MIRPKLQRIASALWPVTLIILLPLIILEALNLWRKNGTD